MANYCTRDGVALSGETPMDVVKSLRATSRDPAPNLVQFMERVAAGAELQTGHRIRIGSAAAFLTDLIAAGLIRSVN
jgi:hypothetical protein